MSADIARSLKPVDALEVSVLVDNVVDPLSTLPKGVTPEIALLRANGMKISSGHARCCANHGLSLVITARDEAYLAVLTDDQKAALEAMKGEALEVDLANLPGFGQ